jgi:toxin ParE1/3/4
MSARKLRTIFAPKASHELENILAYTANEWREAQETIMSDRVAHAIDLIAANPHIGEHRNELLPGMRGFPVEPYFIFYFPDEEQIEILRIVHARTDISRLRFGK